MLKELWIGFSIFFALFLNHDIFFKIFNVVKLYQFIKLIYSTNDGLARGEFGFRMTG